MKIYRLAISSLAALGCIATANATDVEMVIDVAGIERTVIITLDEETAPKTSANFAKLASEGFYNGIRVHRIIPNYIVQTGDPNTKDESQKAKWGEGGPGYTLPAELGGKHVRGAVAAARLGDAVNPERESSGSQFYVALRDITPLDGQYTVFANITSGLEAFDEIAGAPADENNVPTASIKIVRTKVLEKKEEPAPAPPVVVAEPMKEEAPAAPAPAPEPEPASEPAPAMVAEATAQPAPAATPQPEPDPLAAVSTERFAPQGEENMAVNFDKAPAEMPRLSIDDSQFSDAANRLTGRDDGFTPLTEVGGDASMGKPLPSPAPLSDSLSNTGAFPATPAPAPAPAPAPEPAPQPIPEPDPVAMEAPRADPEPTPLPSTAPQAPASAYPIEPDPLGAAPGSEQPVPPLADDPAQAKPKKPEKPVGPLGRFIRRIW